MDNDGIGPSAAERIGCARGKRIIADCQGDDGHGIRRRGRVAEKSGASKKCHVGDAPARRGRGGFEQEARGRAQRRSVGGIDDRHRDAGTADLDRRDHRAVYGAMIRKRARCGKCPAPSAGSPRRTPNPCGWRPRQTGRGLRNGPRRNCP